MHDWLVVGAGLAGLAFARDAGQTGGPVTVLDKSRGVSGRAATRRVALPDGTTARLDHGARFFTARHPRTVALAEGGVREGWNAVWTRGVATLDGRGLHVAQDTHPRYAPPQGLSTLGRVLARGLDIHTGVQVTSLARRGDHWQVHAQDGQTWAAQRLVLNLPAPQLLPLLDPLMLGDALRHSASEGALQAARRVGYAPSWAVGAVLTGAPQWAHPATRLTGGPLEWVALEHTKRPPGHPPALTLQANADWTRAHLDAPPQEVCARLLAAAEEALGETLPTRAAFAHRWRFATPTHRAPGPCHWDAALGLGWCGDWFTPDAHGPRAEAALLSGWALARQVTEGL
ncbi:NAD(P)/FAD-dependent oxidoreductase [Deinococcus multiflagellatus]|uniref:NAD(P)/FAD-dependent oxidoreductase n=1 Tax=Deinococcus multiflagellatus TaxID=1656887 RepID=UPI001CCA9CFE|nr:FAD-dependent oxidoreductase [Deinococcus multiflagellatus]MBZ9713154.1 NAD(P)-binding protein [Deinococcus multiflagellatus]